MQSSSLIVRNRFTVGEWSGTFGDLGTLLAGFIGEKMLQALWQAPEDPLPIDSGEQP